MDIKINFWYKVKSYKQIGEIRRESKITTRKNITINNKKYIFDNQIQDNLAVRTSFDQLAQQTFDISFEEWHKGGWWQENYQPHLLLRDGKVATNLSVNRIGCQINGVRRRMFPTLSHA